MTIVLVNSICAYPRTIFAFISITYLRSRLVPSRYWSVFGMREDWGLGLRRARGLMGREEGNIDETPRAPQPNRQFRAEKRSAQASAHSSSQAQGGNFLCVVCACLLLEFWVKCSRCECLLPVKHFYLTCLLFFSSLENYFGFRTTNVKGKTDHSVSLRWNKRFWTFLKRRVFFLIVHPINLWVDFAALN